MSELNYSKVLTRCMLLSALALALGVVFPQVPPLASFILALVPLIWYHTMYLRPRAAEGLSQAAIDSVYYYGFLVTIGALGATTLGLAFHGISDDFAPVAFQFGLGLLATGYAVWARVHLTASVRVLDEDELRQIMSQQIARSREMLGNVELVSSSFEAFANTLLSKTEQFASDTEVRTRSSVDAALKVFTEGIAALTEQAQIALNDLRGIVNDVTFGAEREALRNSVTAMVETVASLSGGLEQLKVSTSAGASSVGELAGKLERLNAAASASGERLEALGKDGGAIATFGDAILLGTRQTADLGSAVGVASSEFATVSKRTSESRDAIDTIGKKAALAAGKFEKLASALDAAGATQDGLEGAAEKLDHFVQRSEAATRQLAAMQDSLLALQIKADSLAEALAGSTSNLQRMTAVGSTMSGVGGASAAV